MKTTLDKAAPDFAEKKLFTFGFDFPQKVEMKSAASLTPSRSTARLEGWRHQDGRHHRAVGDRPHSRSGRHALRRRRLRQTGDRIHRPATDGKRIEHAELSKSGNEYIGRYDGRPALYVVSDTLIADLQKYVNDMKALRAAAARAGPHDGARSIAGTPQVRTVPSP